MTSARTPTSDSQSSALVASALVITREELPSLLAPRNAALTGVAKSVDRAGLVLIMLATVALVFRPADIFPALADIPIYQACILLCLAASLPRVLQRLTVGSLRTNGITALLLLLTPAVMLSHLSHANTWDARFGGIEMAKACLLFLLILGLVDSVARLKAMLLAVAAGVLAVTVLALLNYHGVLHLSSLTNVVQHSSDTNGPAHLIRLCGTGVFNDPNDYSLILVFAMSVGAYVLSARRAGRAPWLMVVPLALLGYALILTHSRGGLISAVAASLTLLLARFGWRNALPLAGLLALLMFAPFWGRQTDLNLGDPEDTFQARLELWSESLDAFRSAPIFGIGQGTLTDSIGQVTHNSYLHAFAEMGLLGGTLFIGAFYLVLRGLWRASPADPEVARLRPYILAITVGYAVGLLTLSRCYSVPTHLILGLATVFLMLASGSGRVVVPRLDWPCVRRIVGVAAIFLAATYLFVRFMLQRGAA